MPVADSAFVLLSNPSSLLLHLPFPCSPSSLLPRPEDVASDPGVMRTFYQRLFPWKSLFTWLNHDHSKLVLSTETKEGGWTSSPSFFPSSFPTRPAYPVPTKLFTHREFAFTLQGDIYLRYNSFSNAEELKNEVLRLKPSRFEIGPVYSGKVSPPCPFQIAFDSSQPYLGSRDGLGA